MKAMSVVFSRLVYPALVLGLAAMVSGCGVDSENSNQWDEVNEEAPPSDTEGYCDPCDFNQEPLPGTLVTVSSLVFEDVELGSSKSEAASIRNVGSEPVRLMAIQVDGPGFSVTFAEHDTASLPWSIESGAEIDYEVRFAPVDVYEALGEIRWIYDRGDSSETLSRVVQLKGNLACIEPWPGAHTIDEVAVGESETLTVGFSNCSTVTDVVVLSIEMDVWDRGPDGLVPLEPNPFTIELPSLPSVLRAGATLELPVTFAPHEAGEFVAIIMVQADMSGGNSTIPGKFATRVRAFGVK